MEGRRASRIYLPHGITGPTCQVSGCFEPASVYVVIKESDLDSSKIESALFAKSIFAKKDQDPELRDINTFKLILYLCDRHDYDLIYLLKGNELEISRRCHLISKEIR